MEKKHKSYIVGTKRQRKTSLKGAASEPKNLKLDISDIPPIEINNPPSVNPKMKTLIPEKIIPKLNEQDSNQASFGVKSKKTSENIENNENVESVTKKPKKKKHRSEILKYKASIVTTHIKKKKKEKELMAEVQTLKEELGIVGATELNNTVNLADTEVNNPVKSPIPKLLSQDVNLEQAEDKYTILKDKELINKFLKVPMTNNQKGRIRQTVKLSLQGSTTKMFPDIINAKIQAIISSSTDLTDSELRRIRILYNMLKTSLETPEVLKEETPTPKKKGKKKKDKVDGKDKKETDIEQVTKVKGPKRYVVFLGNLPVSITKEKIMEHFRELNEHIVDIRIPKRAPENKSAIAYLELTNEPSYEFALSKHHSMLGTKRIKVLYTTQQKSKVSRAEAKGKSAKLIALQKGGKLIGSVPASKKRSHRRAIMKQAKAKEAAATATE